ncbi:unnamed protein product [Phyllotreta striolata]|uniref:Uncharacterized protein n=1 Tax=Phyllotreta striolata TaxID=444603 RepID=A0A9N9TA31_PHYSR|nr:unnamed protein product [Phyllotreta striolata]
MDEDDHDELLQVTDDDSLSETEDQCLPIDKPAENYTNGPSYFNHTKLEFITTKITLVFATTVILILLPLYIDTINVEGNAYSLILTNTFISTVMLVVTMGIAKVFFEKYRNVNVFSLPVKSWNLLQLSLVYFSSAFMIIYALDRKRVVCHLQDPIKGIVLVFSLLYYFFFCRKIMGLQRIFSATTIVVGIFITVDYGLCDEFRCRGYEREKISEDSGPWSGENHALWTTVYIAGFATFAAYFTLLDRYLLTANEVETQNITMPSTLLSTVSRSVSFPNSNSQPQIIGQNLNNNSQSTKIQSVVHLAMWLHIFGLVFAVLMFWFDILPDIGKGNDIQQFWNYTSNGILCHFQKPQPPTMGQFPCGNVFMYSWIFMCCYILFVVMSMKFLILTQSAVFTIAVMSTSLPLANIWWSLFHASPNTIGLLIWSPSLTGELICAILGLPIMLVGLFLLCKAHLKNCQYSKHCNRFVMSNDGFA